MGIGWLGLASKVGPARWQWKMSSDPVYVQQKSIANRGQNSSSIMSDKDL